METGKTLLNTTRKKQLKLMTFLIALVTATALFIPSMIIGKGYFIFYGDFNVQQIPFYQHCHEMVRSAAFGWDWQTDLGANFIGSYSFYLLGSPFFWLTLPFPNAWVPYMMGPLLILKFACAALTAYMYIRRFTARAETAMLGGLLYAFSGFSVYNVFFNHFHEAIVFFPLLLLAMEVFIAEKQRGPLIAAVFICALSNYFFFFGMVVFVIIYWFIRIGSKSFKFNFLEFLLMLFECVLGVALAMAVLLPTVLAVAQNSRITSFMTGWGSILYGKEQIFLNVIECFFFPPDLPARPVFFPDADVKWSSLGGWLPVFGMTGVFCWLKSEKKGHWLRRVIWVLIFMALVPVLNSAFYMFNTAYYARWFYIPVLMMCLATALAVEDTEVDWNSAWRWNFWIVMAFTFVIGLFPQGLDEKGKITGFGLYKDAATNPIKYLYQSIVHAFDKTQKVDGDFYDLRFWVTCAFAILSLIIIKSMIPLIKEKRTAVIRAAVGCVCAVSVIYSVFFLVSGQTHSYEIEDVMIDNLIEGEITLDMDDDQFARIDVYDGVDNTGLYLGYSSINFFHSIVPGSVTEYYEFIGEKRSVGSRPETDYYGIRALTSVKYLLDPQIDNSKEFMDEYGNYKMPGYKYIGTQNGYKIYENEYYIPFGFTYDYYMTEEQATTFGDKKTNLMLLKALLVSKEDESEVSKLLSNIGNDYNVGTSDEGKKLISFTEGKYKTDCKDRAFNSVDSFKYNSDGFVATIDLKESNYVFFSVPFEEGWSASVNGKAVEIVRANKGFMAVKAEAGANEIVFSYETPGLKIGLIITVLAAFVSAMYLIIVVVKRNYRPVIAAEYPEGDRIATHVMLYEAANFAAEQDENEHLLDDIDRDSIDAYSGFKGGFSIDSSALDELDDDQE